MPKRTTAVLAAVLSMIVATGVVFASHQFPDVPTNSTFHADVDWLVDNGITNGYPNGNFGPNDNVTRGQMAAFLHRYNTDFGPTIVTAIAEPWQVGTGVSITPKLSAAISDTEVKGSM